MRTKKIIREVLAENNLASPMFKARYEYNVVKAIHQINKRFAKWITESYWVQDFGYWYNLQTGASVEDDILFDIFLAEMEVYPEETTFTEPTKSTDEKKDEPAK
jgi:hypothetical protein